MIPFCIVLLCTLSLSLSEGEGEYSSSWESRIFSAKGRSGLAAQKHKTDNVTDHGTVAGSSESHWLEQTS